MGAFERLKEKKEQEKAKISLKQPIKADSDPTTPLSDPTMFPPDKIAKNRQERQERTLSYTSISLHPVVKISAERHVIQPYERVERDRHGRFRPGASGNPAGPEVGIVGYIRLMTDGGREMVDMMLLAARGWLLYRSPEDNTEQWMPVEPKSRLDAMAWLSDRGWGKAVQVIEMPKTQEQEQDFSTFTPEQLRLWLDLDALSRKQLPPTIGSASRTLAEGETADVEAVTPPLPQNAPK